MPATVTKKIKTEGGSLKAHSRTPSVVGTMFVDSDTKVPVDQGTVEFDAEGYMLYIMKKHTDFTKADLPISSDYRWSCTFIPTVILWCSSQCNVWMIPDDEFTAVLQVILDVVYPDFKYRVIPSGSVFAIVSFIFINEQHLMSLKHKGQSTCF